MVWHHPIGGKVSSYNLYLLHTGLAKIGEGGYEDNNNNNIHPRHSNSHWLWAGEISSFKSPVMSHNKAQVSWLREL